MQPDTRPNIQFDEHGVCPPCNYAEVVKNVDWAERRTHLKDIVDFGESQQ